MLRYLPLNISYWLSCICIVSVFALAPQAQAQEAGKDFWVMPGHATASTVRIWVQTKAEATVKVLIYGTNLIAGPQTTTQATGHTTIFDLAGLQENTKYRFDLSINDKLIKDVGNFHTAPAVGSETNFSFVAGSCALTLDKKYKPGRQPKTPKWSRFKIYPIIRSREPDFMLWLGDNIYTRSGEWNSIEGYQYRYSCTRRVAEMQTLLQNTNHYAVWDDHDYGPNNADVSFQKKDIAREAFMQFWANPSYGLENEKDLSPGITTKFSWADCDFFCLDSRTYRTPPKDPIQKIDSDQNESASFRTMLGTNQLAWLFSELKASKATFKFVLLGTQLLNTKVGSVETYMAHYPQERQAILDYISDNNIQNVIFLTGDRHHTDFSAYQANENSPYIYDLTSSALTSFGSPASWNEKNKLRVPGTLYLKPNFALLELKGQGENRALTLTIRNNKDKLIWTQTIGASTGTLLTPPPGKK